MTQHTAVTVKPDETNPLFNDNALKLGLFALNSGGTMMTLAPDRFTVDWDRCDAAMRLASAAGFEVMVSLATWERPEFEPFTWTAALGARHPKVATIATLHVQLMHPTFVARAIATQDHITHGRAAINIVAGSNPATYGNFGVAFEDHETRYAHAEEFMELLYLLWSSEGPVSFDGRFYQVKSAICQPKPLQGRPAIMNAGTSERGLDFAAKHADIVFTHLPDGDIEATKALTAHCKRVAFEKFGRKVQVWTHAYVVMRDSQEEADAFLRYYAVEYADRARVEAYIKTLGKSGDAKTESWKFERNWAAGGGIGLVGTPQTVAAQLVALNKAGVDGILLNSTEPERMLASAAKDLLPLLQQAGVRAP
jgi:alkanesulfonate monooxygenase SsuD/methylene tetrahydromethanopterin reductase-like flavin-dependent oxidoreductase (luciferase family)